LILPTAQTLHVHIHAIGKFHVQSKKDTADFFRSVSNLILYSAEQLLPQGMLRSIAQKSLFWHRLPAGETQHRFAFSENLLILPQILSESLSADHVLKACPPQYLTPLPLLIMINLDFV